MNSNGHGAAQVIHTHHSRGDWLWESASFEERNNRVVSDFDRICHVIATVHKLKHTLKDGGCKRRFKTFLTKLKHYRKYFSSPPSPLLTMHTSNIVPAQLAEGVWCTKFQSSLLNIYFRHSNPVLSPTYLLISHLFASTAMRIGVHIAPKNGSKSIPHVTLHLQDRHGAARPHFVAETALKSPFLYMDRSSIR